VVVVVVVVVVVLDVLVEITRSSVTWIRNVPPPEVVPLPPPLPIRPRTTEPPVMVYVVGVPVVVVVVVDDVVDIGVRVKLPDAIESAHPSA